MTRRLFLTGFVCLGLAPSAQAQSFRPQSPAGLSVTFSTERAGGARILIFGEVRNATGEACERVSLRAEGLDAEGHVVSRARGWVPGSVPARGSAPFEIRLLAGGTERRFRIVVETFEFTTRTGPEGP